MPSKEQDVRASGDEARRARRARRGLALLLALGLPLLGLISLAEGQPKKPASKPAPAAESKYDPDNITAISQYMETCVKGNEKLVAKDPTAAIDLYKKAVQLSPKQALAHYLLAEAYISQQNLGEAEASIKEAMEAQDTGKNPALRSRVLFLNADILEREKQWDKAKAAWQLYAEHNARNADAGFPQTAAERIKTIQKILDMEKQYVEVRARIAAEKDGGTKQPTPAPPTKK